MMLSGTAKAAKMYRINVANFRVPLVSYTFSTAKSLTPHLHNRDCIFKGNIFIAAATTTF